MSKHKKGKWTVNKTTVGDIIGLNTLFGSDPADTRKEVDLGEQHASLGEKLFKPSFIGRS